MLCMPMPSPVGCSESRPTLEGRLRREGFKSASPVDVGRLMVTTLPDDIEPERVLGRCFWSSDCEAALASNASWTAETACMVSNRKKFRVLTRVYTHALKPTPAPTRQLSLARLGVKRQSPSTPSLFLATRIRPLPFPPLQPYTRAWCRGFAGSCAEPD
jgi:hypothetical protein